MPARFCRSRGWFAFDAQVGFAADNRLWGVVAGIMTIALATLCALVLVRGLQALPHYASPNDGLDPGTSPCSDSAMPVQGDDHPVLRDDTGRVVGHVELRRSAACATVWAKVLFDPAASPTVKGEVAMVRDADRMKAAFALPL